MRLSSILLIVICSMTLLSCSIEEEPSSEKSAELFFEKFKARTDWEGFKDLYADNLEFEDVVYGLKYGKEEFFNFYNWPDTAFHKHPNYPNNLVLEDLAITDSSAVGRGYFNPFYYQGQLMAVENRWRFTIWLYFDKAGKIKRHIDYIDYPAAFVKSAAESRLAK